MFQKMLQGGGGGTTDILELLADKDFTTMPIQNTISVEIGDVYFVCWGNPNPISGSISGADIIKKGNNNWQGSGFIEYQMALIIKTTSNQITFEDNIPRILMKLN